MTAKTTDLELRIIEAAKQVFVEKGYAETNMSDIAACAGINRPTLHYYFRTKDRMFQAVFSSIVERLVPQVQDIVRRRDLAVKERTEQVVDAYYNVFRLHPDLPMFIMRETKRDFDFVLKTVEELQFQSYFESIRREIQQQMDEGLIAKLPMRHLFLTFYSLLTFPFNLKAPCERVLLNEGETFDDLLDKWKTQIGEHIAHMLQP